MVAIFPYITKDCKLDAVVIVTCQNKLINKI